MNRTELLARCLQIQSQDRTALSVYDDLSRRMPDIDGRAVFRVIAEDERRHTKLQRELLELLQTKG